LSLDTPDPLFRLRVAVGLLRFVANFLLAHAHVQVEAAALAVEVDRAPDQEYVDASPQKICDGVSDPTHARAHALKGELEEKRKILFRDPVNSDREDGKQDHGLNQVREILSPYVREVADDVEALEIGSELLEGEAQPRYGEVRRETHSDQRGAGQRDRVRLA